MPIFSSPPQTEREEVSTVRNTFMTSPTEISSAPGLSQQMSVVTLVTCVTASRHQSGCHSSQQWCGHPLQSPATGGFVTKSGCCLTLLLAIGKLGLSGGISLLVMAQFRSYSWHNPNKMLSSPQLCPSHINSGSVALHSTPGRDITPEKKNISKIQRYIQFKS